MTFPLQFSFLGIYPTFRRTHTQLFDNHQSTVYPLKKIVLKESHGPYWPILLESLIATCGLENLFLNQLFTVFPMVSFLFLLILGRTCEIQWLGGLPAEARPDGSNGHRWQQLGSIRFGCQQSSFNWNCIFYI